MFKIGNRVKISETQMKISSNLKGRVGTVVGYDSSFSVIVLLDSPVSIGYDEPVLAVVLDVDDISHLN